MTNEGRMTELEVYFEQVRYRLIETFEDGEDWFIGLQSRGPENYQALVLSPDRAHSITTMSYPTEEAAMRDLARTCRGSVLKTISRVRALPPLANASEPEIE